MSAIEEIEGPSLPGIVESEGRGVLVDFWSPWCAPCRIMRPHLGRLAVECEEHWRFIAVNAESAPDTAAAFGVQSLPTLIYFRGGEEVHRFRGAAAISDIAAKLDEHSAAPSRVSRGPGSPGGGGGEGWSR